MTIENYSLVEIDGERGVGLSLFQDNMNVLNLLFCYILRIC